MRIRGQGWSRRRGLPDRRQGFADWDIGWVVGSWSVDLDLYLSLYRAQEWKTSTYSNSFVPFASLGVSHHWDKISLGVKFTFSPKNSAASSTADFNIIYSYVYLGIYI